MDLDTEGGHVLLLELTSQVTLDEGGLSGTRISVSVGAPKNHDIFPPTRGEAG